MRRCLPRAASVLFACSVLAASPRPLTITLPNRPDTVKFAVIGDSGTGTRPQFEVAARMVEARDRFDFAFVIMLGDNLYGRQRPEDFVARFARPYQTLLAAGVTFHAALGNHDRPTSRFYGPWNMNGERYYTYVKGDVRFFVLDSSHMDSTQVDWLARTLERSTDRWKIAYFHHPLYSSAARHGSDTSLRRRLEPLLVRFGVNAVFSGHDHTYERLRPQRGIQYFVSGSAGQLRRGNLRTSQLTAAGFDQDNAFMLVEIEENAMSVQTLARDGRTVDAVMISRQPSRAEPPTAASGRQAPEAATPLPTTAPRSGSAPHR